MKSLQRSSKLTDQLLAFEVAHVMLLSQSNPCIVLSVVIGIRQIHTQIVMVDQRRWTQIQWMAVRKINGLNFIKDESYANFDFWLHAGLKPHWSWERIKFALN